MKSRLETLYNDQMQASLLSELKLKNIMQVPKLVKIVINTGVKEAVQDSRILNGIAESIGLIAGQKPVKTHAKKSIAGFKLREGVAIGCCVTLRREKMYHFLDKLINIALPSVRDFRGVGIRFDGRGNYTLGIKDWMVFPEIEYDKVAGARGLGIVIHTTATNDSEARALLNGFKMPFVQKG